MQIVALYCGVTCTAYGDAVAAYKSIAVNFKTVAIKKQHATYYS
jgi:glutaredoxin-related protein